MNKVASVVFFLFGVVFVLLLVYIGIHLGSADGFCMPTWAQVVEFASTNNAAQRALALRGEVADLQREVESFNLAEQVVFYVPTSENWNVWDLAVILASNFYELLNVLGKFFPYVGNILQIVLKSIAVVLNYVAVPFEIVGWVMDGSMFVCPIP